LDEHGFGKLEVGGTANVSLIRETEKAVEVEDADGERRTTQTWIEPVGCIVDGSYFRTEEPI
jgi:predicted amidohydrolase